MEFFCKYSAETIKFFKQLEEEGKDVPALNKMPVLFFDAAPFWVAFMNLSSSRQIGMGLGAIPYSEITGWLTENGIVRFEDRERYRRFIDVLDKKYLEIKNTEKG